MVFQRFHDAVNSGDLGAVETAIEAIFHPEARFHTADGPVDLVPAQRRIWAVLLAAFPDLHVTVEDEFTSGDRVVARQTVTGTNTGEYRGRPPTGRPVTYQEIFIARVDDGRAPPQLKGVAERLGG